MKLHFEPDLDFQREAIEAVCDLFRGQEVCRTEFTVIRDPRAAQMRLGFSESDLGVGNRLTLLDDEILKNLNEVQLRSGLPPSPTLVSGDFTVEMETGTGKTYVYLRTIFELNKRYGFTKFVIVVPSIAIKEGVYHSVEILEEHLRSLNGGVAFSNGNNYFLYDSAKLGQVRNFATSSQIQVMVVTVGAINKQDVNNLYKDSEKTGGERPIDLIKATRPIVIVDEPQSVDGGLEGRGRAALDAMNPLCTLRYSATHVDKHHMVYRLDAVDAYERKLVKQIEVASATVEDAHNRPYVKLLSTRSHRGTVEALVELDVATSTGKVRRREVRVNDGYDLQQTTDREIYEDFLVGEIRAGDDPWMELRVPGREPLFLRPGEGYGNVDEDAVAREMIRRTIREHLDKEKRLRPRGIKVLSLFFVPRVDLYRVYDEDGRQQKGLYARIFEEEYRRFIHHPDYRTLFQEVDVETAPEDVHNGYFSIDKKGTYTEPELDKQGELRNQRSREDAERAYNLIMKDKEALLGFETPLKFIFSHSALKEGWDNPNVFQICSLRDIRTERERRQTIGRGLRICVNQEGQRVRGFEVNTLTVVAREGYKEFAENLQKEIEKETGIRFGVVQPHEFAAIQVPAEDGAIQALGVTESEALWEYLKVVGYIDARGKVQDSLRKDLKEDLLKLPEERAPQEAQITDILRKLAGRLEIKNADERRPVQPRRAILHSQEFKELWNRIKQKTTYRVRFDNEKLVEECIRAVRKAPPIPKTRLQWRKADLAIGKAGVEATESSSAPPVTLNEDDIELPDVLTELQDRTQLTRRTIYRVLTGSGRLDDFSRNPQAYIELAGEAINRCKGLALVDGIKYQRLGDDHYYAQELFEQEELVGYLKNMVLEAKKSVYEEVVYDSETEARFAQDLEKNEAVKVYAKLPGWFEVPTPLGGYNPDWAVLIERDGEERLYLVVETKGSQFVDDLRDKERAKIEYGRAHFEALDVCEPRAEYKVATSVDELLAGL